MTVPNDRVLSERITELAATVETWQDAHASAEDAAMKQLDTMMNEARGLQRALRARHERYRSELAALCHKLTEMASEADQLPEGRPCSAPGPV